MGRVPGIRKGRPSDWNLLATLLGSWVILKSLLSPPRVRGRVGLGPGDTVCPLFPQKDPTFISRKARFYRGSEGPGHRLKLTHPAGGRAGSPSQLSYILTCLCEKEISAPHPCFPSPMGKQAPQALLVVKSSGRQLGKSLNTCMPSDPVILLLELDSKYIIKSVWKYVTAVGCPLLLRVTSARSEWDPKAFNKSALGILTLIHLK